MAAPPVFTSLFPAGGALGETVTVELVGSHLDTSTFWSTIPGLTFKKAPEKNQWWITIPASAPIGPALLYAKNPDGVSAPRWFSVGRLPEITEIEPNNQLSEAHKIESLPATINGNHKLSTDADVFAVKLTKGQTLYTFVEGYSLGASIDPHLHILNEKGTRIATFSESQNLDPLLEFTAPETGTYFLELAAFAHPPEANVNYKSSANSSYRLHLHTGPLATSFTSPAVHANQITKTTLQGLNLNPNQSQVDLDPKFFHRLGSNITALLPQAIVPIPVAIVSTPLGVEKEPNNTEPAATRLPSLGSITGSIDPENDRDLFVFSGKKGQKIKVRVLSNLLANSVDTTLKVYSTPDKLLLNLDDVAGSPDPLGTLTLAADGDYYVEVASNLPAPTSFRQYVLSIDELKPAFTAAIELGTPLVLPPGESVEISVAFKFDPGYTGEVKLNASNLPPGVQSEAIKVEPKNATHKLKLEAATNASPQQVQLKIECWDAENQITPAWVNLRGEDKRGTTLLDQADFLWLTIPAVTAKK